MNKRVLILSFVLLILSATQALAMSNEGRAKEFVNRGIVHLKAFGLEQATKDFMDPESGFIMGSYYLLFYKYDGTCIALGAKPEIAGLNRWDVQDPDGVYQVREMIKTAQNGGGWVKYQYANPITGEVQPKKTWVKPIPGMEAFIGCGVY